MAMDSIDPKEGYQNYLALVRDCFKSVLTPGQIFDASELVEFVVENLKEEVLEAILKGKGGLDDLKRKIDLDKWAESEGYTKDG
jgi:hypothetical protein